MQAQTLSEAEKREKQLSSASVQTNMDVVGVVAAEAQQQQSSGPECHQQSPKNQSHTERLGKPVNLPPALLEYLFFSSPFFNF